ncbi:MAG: hypothetical protein ACFFG0_10675 [Candidatus Thorarchaeota archaeon]
MFDAILKILASHDGSVDSYHVTESEFFFIKEFFDDAVHLIYAQEKNHSREGDLKKNKTWQAVYALAKEWLIKCNKMMIISERRSYDEHSLQMITTPVYVIHKNMVAALMRLSNRLNSIYGLADGNEIGGILNQLRAREQELQQQLERTQSQVQVQQDEEDFYQVER